jgi:hypothetical protein
MIDDYTIQVRNSEIDDSRLHIELDHNYQFSEYSLSLHSLLQNSTNLLTPTETISETNYSSYSFDYQLDDDVYTAKYSIDNQVRIQMQFTLDNLPPQITAFNSTSVVFENQTSQEDWINFIFNVTDEISPLHHITFDVYLNTEKLATRYYGPIFPDQFGVYLTVNQLDSSRTEQVIIINATDASSNNALFNYTFYYYLHVDMAVPSDVTTEITNKVTSDLPVNGQLEPLKTWHLVLGSFVFLSVISLVGYKYRNKLYDYSNRLNRLSGSKGNND